MPPIACTRYIQITRNNFQESIKDMVEIRLLSIEVVIPNGEELRGRLFCFDGTSSSLLHSSHDTGLVNGSWGLLDMLLG